MKVYDAARQKLIIDDLSQLLIDGLRNYQATVAFFHSLQQEKRYIKSTEEKALLKEYKQKTQQWYIKVITTIEKQYPNSLYLFQMEMPQETTATEYAFSKAVLQFLSSFKAHLYALEHIIETLSDTLLITVRQEILEKELGATAS